MEPLDSGLYRDAMSRYAGHVQLVTTQYEGERRGVIVTAACSVSDSPPCVLVCLNNLNPKNDIFARSGIFALNTLASHHRLLADAFSGRNSLPVDERFGTGLFEKIITGAPVLSDALASFDCHITDIKKTSTHNVIFGEVAAVRFKEPEAALIYLNREYRTL